MRLFALLVNKICYASFLELSCLCTHNIFFYGWTNAWHRLKICSRCCYFLLVLHFARRFSSQINIFARKFTGVPAFACRLLFNVFVLCRCCCFFVVFLFSSFINVVVVIVFYCEIHNLKSKIFMMAYQDTYMNESHSFHSYEIAVDGGRWKKTHFRWRMERFKTKLLSERTEVFVWRWMN